MLSDFKHISKYKKICTRLLVESNNLGAVQSAMIPSETIN